MAHGIPSAESQNRPENEWWSAMLGFASSVVSWIKMRLAERDANQLSKLIISAKKDPNYVLKSGGT